MLTRCLIVLAGMLSVATSAIAQSGREQGWGLFFNQDSFTQTVFPVAMKEEEDADFDGVNVGVACGSAGTLVPFFTQRMRFSNDPILVDFRSGETAISVEFIATDVPNLGTLMALNLEQADAFLSMFRSATDNIAYRTEARQGQFSAIAAENVFDMVLSNCP